MGIQTTNQWMTSSEPDVTTNGFVTPELQDDALEGETQPHNPLVAKAMETMQQQSQVISQLLTMLASKG